MKALDKKIKNFTALQKLPERKTRVLCSNVERIDNLANALAEAWNSAEVLKLTKEIKRVNKEIHLQALAMEKRLYLYKETIEKLGFKRVRGKN